MSSANKVVWHERLWVRTYLAIFAFTFVLATLGLLAWELSHNSLETLTRSFSSQRTDRSPYQRSADRLTDLSRDDSSAASGRPEMRSTGKPSVFSDAPDEADQPIARLGPSQGRAGKPRDFNKPPVHIAIVMVVITGLALLIAAYPVARRLTRSLESVSDQVGRFGQGSLAARVKTSAKGEVRMLADRFNESADRIEKLVKAQSSLLANVSHELRSPLARIRMQIEEIGVAPNEQVQREINRDIAELDALIEEILLASRLQSTHQPMAAEEVELLALAAEEAARVGAKADGVIAFAIGDKNLLRRVLRNMLENAVRYGGDADAVEARVTLDGAWLFVQVLDRGPGVPTAEQERIFEPFYRARGAREKAGGVGLGLSLSKQIAADHKGTLTYRRRDGGGACFELKLPQIEAEANATPVSASTVRNSAGLRQ